MNKDLVETTKLGPTYFDLESASPARSVPEQNGVDPWVSPSRKISPGYRDPCIELLIKRYNQMAEARIQFRQEELQVTKQKLESMRQGTFWNTGTFGPSDSTEKQLPTPTPVNLGLMQNHFDFSSDKAKLPTFNAPHLESRTRLEEYVDLVKQGEVIILKLEEYQQVVKNFHKLVPSVDFETEVRKLMRCYLREQFLPLIAMFKDAMLPDFSPKLSSSLEKPIVKKVLEDLKTELDRLYPTSDGSNAPRTTAKLVHFLGEHDQKVFQKEANVFGVSFTDGGVRL